MYLPEWLTELERIFSFKVQSCGQNVMMHNVQRQGVNACIVLSLDLYRSPVTHWPVGLGGG